MNEMDGLQMMLAQERAIKAELLDALETLLDSINGQRVTVGDCNQARAAIAKATGEPK